jgi:hypothetical protein
MNSAAFLHLQISFLQRSGYLGGGLQLASNYQMAPASRYAAAFNNDVLVS